MILKEFLVLNENYKNLFTHQAMEKYADEVYDILTKSYEKIGGIHMTKKQLVDESDMWKLYVKDGKILIVLIYKDKGGRKLIASGTDGSVEAKKIYIANKAIELDRSYAEMSGATEHLVKKNIGSDTKFKIPAKDLFKLTGKIPLEIDPDEHHYTRMIGDKVHKKAMYGTPGLKIIPK